MIKKASAIKITRLVAALLFFISLQPAEAFLQGTIPISAFDLSPDDTFYITTDYDRQIQQWDVFTGERVASYQSPDFSWAGDELQWLRVTDVEISPDGHRVAISYGLAGAYGAVLIIDLQTGHLLQEFDAGIYAGAISWHPEGTYLSTVYSYSSGVASTSFLAILNTDDATISFEQQTGSINAVAWSPSGTSIAYSQGETRFAILDVTTSNVLLEVDLVSERVLALSWSSDNGLLLVASEENLIIWNVTSNTETRRFSRDVDGVGRPYAAWSSDGNYIASSNFSVIEIIDVNSGAVVYSTDVGALVSGLEWLSNNHLLYGARTVGVLETNLTSPATPTSTPSATPRHSSG